MYVFGLNLNQFIVHSRLNLSLKNYLCRNGIMFYLSSLSHKASTFRDLKSSLLYKGLSVSTTATSGLGQSNYLRYNKGNITYVIPYRHKVILPRFKTPSQQHH